MNERTKSNIIRAIAVLSILSGVVLIVVGGVTWNTVSDELSQEQIVVAKDAANYAGEKVDGPFTAYSQADVIKHHALEASDGLTYAQLDREDPRRENAVKASFLRASLFTSVVAFGVAALAMGIGVLFILVGVVILLILSKLLSKKIVVA